ncbi:MAG: response regulator [Planctomycetes bacterium]|nr:response regulator [Planctomycetota bacterium]
MKELNILLVEDAADFRDLIKVYLRRLKARVDEALNGEEAVKLFTEKTYDIVLMDMQMPVMDGFAATRRIRELEGGERRVPIIAMTAYDEIGTSRKCKSAGSDYYLVKPIQREYLLRLIQDLTDSNHSAVDE